MTIQQIQKAATKAGREHAISQGRPPAPWTREDLQIANSEMHRLTRLHKIDMFALPNR